MKVCGMLRLRRWSGIWNARVLEVDARVHDGLVEVKRRWYCSRSWLVNQLVSIEAVDSIAPA